MGKSFSFLLLFLPFCASSQPLQDGSAYENAGQFLHAQMSYQQAMGKSKDLPEIRRRLGILFLKTQQWQRAERYFSLLEGPAPASVEDVIALKPATRHFDLPVLKIPEKVMDGHEEENKQLVAGNPRHAKAHYDLGVHYWSLSDHDSLAEYHFRQAIASRSEYPEARRSLGHLLQWQGRLGEAEIHLRFNAERYPDTFEYWDDLASLYYLWKRLGKLEQTWRDQLKTFPKDLKTLRNLGYLLDQQGRYVEVEQLFLEYQYAQKDPANGFGLLEEHYRYNIDSYPDSVRFYRALAELYDRKIFEEEGGDRGDKALARQCLALTQTVLEKKPAHPERGQLNYQIGRLQLLLGNCAGAIAPLKEAVALMQEKTDPSFLLIDAYECADRPLDALRLLEPLAAEPGLDYRHDVLLARLLALDGRLEESLALADSIIAYYPNSRTPESYRIRAYVLEQQGDMAGAFDALLSGIFFDYASATDYYQIAKLYFRQEPWREGLVWLDGALEKGLPRILLRHDPELDRLREDADFKEVLSHHKL